MSRKNPRFHRVNPVLPPATGNVFQVSLIGAIENQLTINNFYYQDGNQALIGGASPTESDMANAFIGTGPYSQIRQASSTDWTSLTLRVACISQPARIPWIVQLGPPNAGTITGGHEPTTVAAIISRYTGTRGQSGRGRVYLPGVPTANVASSSITAAGVTAYNAVVSSMLATLTGTTRSFTPGLVSRRGVVLSQGNFPFAPLTSGQLRTVLGTVRRRRLGRGK